MRAYWTIGFCSVFLFGFLTHLNIGFIRQIALNLARPLLYNPNSLVRQVIDVTQLDPPFDVTCRNYTLNDIPERSDDEVAALQRQRGCRAFTANVSQVEVDHPIAFILKVYHNAEQFERLLRAIYRPFHVYCIHIDSNATQTFQHTVRTITQCFRHNVLFPDRFAESKWGTMGALMADLYCMQLLASEQHYDKWLYLINLTGEEYPLKSMHEIALMLQALDGRSIIGSCPNPRRFEDRHMIKFAVDNGQMKPTDEKHSPLPASLKSITICKGDVAGVFGRKLVKYIVEDSRALQLQQWLNESLIPDEYLWPTLFCNAALQAPGAFQGDIATLKHEDFQSPIRAKWWFSFTEQSLCLSRFVRELCVFNVNTMPNLFERSNPIAMFVNKFQLSEDRHAFRCAELHFEFRTRWSQNWQLDELQRLVISHKLISKSRNDSVY